MNCPVCNRNNANTLSICPSCGAMSNDSVREELKNKISPAVKTVNVQQEGKFPMKTETNQPARIAGSPKSISAKTETSEIDSRPPSPTLVEFHSKNTAVPEWRLQLQNTVRQRQDRSGTENGKASFPPVQKTRLVMSGATALKVKPIEKTEELEIAQVKNPTLSSALERIKNSRQKFLIEEEQLKTQAIISEVPKPNKNYPFHIAGRIGDDAPKKAIVNGSPNFPVKPALAVPLKTENENLDTNKLPAIPKPVKIPASFEKRAVVFGEETNLVEAKDFDEKIEIVEKAKTEIRAVETKEAIKAETKAIEAEETESEEIDDCAPLALRFNAGLFDLIIGSFFSLLLLSPFILTGGNWLTLAGVAAFLATCAVVMFVYMTAAIGKYGKTFGMRLFSLEIIDAEGENYPTLHQAAVSSSLYLVSLALGGIGFITMVFNEEKRAVHDLVSGTIVVKEL